MEQKWSQLELFCSTNSHFFMKDSKLNKKAVTKGDKRRLAVSKLYIIRLGNFEKFWLGKKAFFKKIHLLSQGDCACPWAWDFHISYLFPPRTCEKGICHPILQIRKPKAIMKKFSNFTKVSYIWVAEPKFAHSLTLPSKPILNLICHTV